MQLNDLVFQTQPVSLLFRIFLFIFFAHYFLANDTSLNFYLMTQLRVLTVDSGWFVAGGETPRWEEGGWHEVDEVGYNHSL